MKRQAPSIEDSSGRSNAARLANAHAVRMDREQIAEMCRSSGDGGDIAPREDVTPACAIDLTEHGIAKRRSADLLAADFERMHRMLPERVAALPG